MLTYLTRTGVIRHKGPRIDLAHGMPRPWGQAAKSALEIKGLDYVLLCLRNRRQANTRRGAMADRWAFHPA